MADWTANLKAGVKDHCLAASKEPCSADELEAPMVALTEVAKEQLMVGLKV
jgi:hypothetical protein